MANTTLTRLVAAASLALVLPLSACGSGGDPSEPFVSVCMGPEDADDLEDLLDRDDVVHDPSRCNGTDPAFRLVSVVAPAPPVGSELEDDGSGHYRRAARHGGPAASRASTPSPVPAGATRANTGAAVGAPPTTAASKRTTAATKETSTKETRRRTGGR